VTIPEDRRTSLDLDLELPASSGAPAERALLRAPCTSCGLTSTGDEALRRELDRLTATSPDGGWHAELCADCGGVCLVVDHDEDWILGAPPVGPVTTVGPGPRPAPAGIDEPEPPLLPPAADEEPVDPKDVVREILARSTARPVPPGPAAAPALPDAWAFSSRRRNGNGSGPALGPER
jgi:hypothetical protein